MIHLSDDQKNKEKKEITARRGHCTFAVFKIKRQIFGRVCRAAHSDLTAQRRIDAGMFQIFSDNNQHRLWRK